MMRSLRSSRRRALSAAALLIGLLGPAALFEAMADDQIGTITVGLNYEGSGPWAAYGTDTPTILRMLTSKFDKDPLVVGGKKYKVVLQALDNRSEPQQSVSVERRLVSEGVKFIVGPATSPNFMPAAEIGKGKAIQFTTGTQSGTLLGKPGYDTVFKALNAEEGPNGSSAKIVRLATDYFKPKRPASLLCDDDVCKLVQQYYADALGTHGLTLAASENFKVGNADFSAILLRIKQTNPDLLFFGTGDDAGAQIVRQALELRVTDRFVGVSGPTESSAKGYEDKVDYLFDAFVPSPNSDNPEVQAWVKDVKAATGKTVTDPNWSWAMVYYNHLLGLFQAMQKAETTTDVAAIIKALHNSSWNAIGGVIKVDEKGQSSNCFSVGHVKDGKVTYQTAC